MTSAPAASLSQLQHRRPLITPLGWCGIIGLGLLFVLVHGTYLERLFRIVTHASGDNLLQLLLSALTADSWNADWSHALIVPLISAYYIFHHRHTLAQARARVWFPALPLVFLGLVGYAFWVYPGRNDMFQGYSMLITLFGLVWFLLGPEPMRVLWFPIAFLVFGIKIADALWERIAWELQQVASMGAMFALKFFTAFLDFDVARRGTTLDLIFVSGGVPVHESLNVAEACSGLRSLMAFIALGTAMAFLWGRPWWQRIIMVLASVPIAVGVNIARVTAIGLLYLVDPKYAHGDFHTMVGMLMLIPAAGLFLLLGWIMDRIIVRDDEESPPAGAGPAASHDPKPPQPQTDSSEGISAADVRKLLPIAGAALVIGALAMAVTAGIYWLMFTAGAPLDTGSWQLNMIVLMAWISLPAAIVGSVIGIAAWKGLAPLARRLPDVGGAPAVRLTAMALVAGVLVTMAAGQTAVVRALDVVLIKKPVPMRHPLVMIPSTVGQWELLREDPPLPREQVEELGTEQYISRIYRDTDWPSDEPGGIVRLHVAYYTGTTDTVPHVPDRCFVAGGLQGIGKGITELTLATDGFRRDPVHGGWLADVQPRRGDQPLPHVRLPETRFDATYFTFGAPSRSGRQANSEQLENVIYFFAANGKFLPTPNAVRSQGFDTSDQYSYYCKVEVQMFGISDPAVAATRASDFLSSMLPEVMACLPDWVDVSEGRWPADNADIESVPRQMQGGGKPQTSEDAQS